MKIQKLRCLSLMVGAFLLMASVFSHLFADDSTETFTVKAGAFPWSDRVSVWQLANVPASVDGNGPYPQQNCGSRSITVPDHTAYLILGVSDKDVERFKTDFPTAQPTGDTIAVTHTDGTAAISYTIFKIANPPGSVGDKDFVAGLILLQINDKPAPGPKPDPVPTK